MKASENARANVLSGLTAWSEELRKAGQALKAGPEPAEAEKLKKRVDAARGELRRLLDAADAYGMDDPIVQRMHAARSQWPAN